MILDTDMVKHGSLMEKINAIQDFTQISQNEKITLMSAVLHAADISNPAMPFKDFRDWGLRMC